MIVVCDSLGGNIKPHPVYSFFSRMMGSLRAKARQAPAVLIYPRASVHKIFMQEPVDLMILDRDKKILKIHRQMRSHRTIGCLGAAYIIEAQPGVLAAGLKEGDSFIF